MENEFQSMQAVLRKHFLPEVSELEFNIRHFCLSTQVMRTLYEHLPSYS